MTNRYWILNLCLALLFAPVLFGIINKVKAFFAGRKGPKLLQPWYDIVKLLKKASVYSKTTTFCFKLAPVVTLTATVIALLFLPLGLVDSPFGFRGDAILFLYLFGLARMVTVTAAVDTGSSFEGMGGARELQFSVISEGTLILLLAFLAMLTGGFDLSTMLNYTGDVNYAAAVPGILLSAAALYIVMLAECCRVPVDDPETHLELTMIHEAMILDNGGPDLAMIHYASALKLWAFSSLLTALVFPATELSLWALTLISLAGAVVCAVCIGVTESIMARYRFLKVPQLLFGSFCIELAALAMLIISGGIK